MKPFSLNTAPPSRLLLYALLALTALVYAAFYLIGYHRSYENNPLQDAPLLTGVLIGFALLVLMGSLAVALWAVFRAGKRRQTGQKEGTVIPSGRIAATIALVLLLVLALSYVASSSAPLSINGATYHHTAILKTAGMFTFTAIFMLLVACIAAMAGRFFHRSNKK